MKFFSFSPQPINILLILIILVTVYFVQFFYFKSPFLTTSYFFSNIGNFNKKYWKKIIGIENEFSNNFNFSTIDKQSILSKKEIFDLTEKDSNLALNYWSEWKQFNANNVWNKKDVKICNTELPSPLSIKFNNIYWQSVINTENLTIFLFNAYYDNIQSTKKVRIVTVTDHYLALARKKLW
jgi:hypothetical protein